MLFLTPNQQCLRTEGNFNNRKNTFKYVLCKVNQDKYVNQNSVKLEDGPFLSIKNFYKQE